MPDPPNLMPNFVGVDFNAAKAMIESWDGVDLASSTYPVAVPKPLGHRGLVKSQWPAPGANMTPVAWVSLLRVWREMMSDLYGKTLTQAYAVVQGMNPPHDLVCYEFDANGDLGAPYVFDPDQHNGDKFVESQTPDDDEPLDESADVSVVVVLEEPP